MNNDTDTPLSINENSVAEFLRHNKRFLLNNPDILSAMELDHDSGQAVSLIERQVRTLREQVQQSEHRLECLVSNARSNDQLLEKTQRLVLAVIEAHDVGDIVDALFYSLNKEFDIKHVKLLLTNGHAQINNVETVNQDDIESYIRQNFTQDKTIFSGLKTEQIAYFFGDDAQNIGSAAIALLRYGSETQGVLAIGNADIEHYQHASGTLFLQHICDVLTRTLNKVL